MKLFLRALYFSLSLLALSHANPPTEIPSDLHDAFTLNGAIPVTYTYYNDSYPSTKPLIYRIEYVNYLYSLARVKCRRYYGKTDTYLYDALDNTIGNFQGKSVGIIGSTKPWYEAIALVYGASVTTIEYNKILTNHPLLTTLTVDEYNQNPIKFDYLFSISSFEHDGLGRYGDPLNPHGDFDAMNKAKSMLKPGGYLFLAVPVGQDNLTWNAHRVYGPKRLELLLSGWDIVATFGFHETDFDHFIPSGEHQPVFVLTPSLQ